MASGSGISAEQIAHSRLTKVFKFLKELDELRNPVQRDTSSYPAVLKIDEWPVHPCIEIRRGDPTADEGLNESADEAEMVPFIRVKRAQLSPCPKPPPVLDSWLKPNWNLIEAEPEVLTVQNLPDKKAGSIAIRFADDAERVAAFAEWKARRATWAVGERPAVAAREIFERIHALWMTVQRESNRLELVVADGMLCVPNLVVKHPVLFQKVTLAFNANVPEFTFTPGTEKIELYKALLRLVPEIDGRIIAALDQELDERPVEPLGGLGASGFFRRVIQGSFREGEYLEARPSARDLPEGPSLWREPMALLRPRTAGLSSTLDYIVEDLERKESAVPEGLVRIVGVETGAESPHSPGTDEAVVRPTSGDPQPDILFSKPANHEQYEIAARLAKSNAVLVQGPPGTGKTHTIANLIGYLLAQGKTVLVTAHTTKALRVLRGQLDEALQPLCLSVLDSDVESQAELSHAAQEIASRLSRSDAAFLRRQAALLRAERQKQLKNAAALRQQLRDARFSEIEEIVVGGEGTSPIEAAKRVKADAGRDGWIPGPIRPGVLCPLSDSEVFQLYASQGAISPGDELQLSVQQPLLEKLVSPADFRMLAQEKEGAAKRSQAHRTDLWDSHVATEYVSTHLQQLHQRVAMTALFLSEPQNWLREVLFAGWTGGGHAQAWEELIEAINSLTAAAGNAQTFIIAYGPELPNDVPSPEVNFKLTELVQFLENGGTIGFWTRIKRRNWHRLIEKCRVEGRPPRTLDEFRSLSALAKVVEERERLCARWRRAVETLGGPEVQSLGSMPERAAQSYASEIRARLDWRKNVWEPLIAELTASGFRWLKWLGEHPPVAGDYGELTRIQNAASGRLAEIVEAQAALIKQKELAAALQEQRAYLSRFSKSDAASVLIEAMDSWNTDNYEEACRELIRLEGLREVFTNRRALLAKLDPSAPAWAQAIANRQKPHDAIKPPGLEVGSAWRWRSWLEELNRRAAVSIPDLQERLTATERDLRRLAAKIIEHETWAAQRERTKLSQQQALVGFVQTLRKVGKGTGKYAPDLLRHARQLLADARHAVPVWIMPLNRVYESFDPREKKFDVVIIDEASQSDVSALAALYLGRDHVVVGDKEQVTPDAVGQKLDQVQRLISTDLREIPNSHLYDGQTSIYDLAETAFGGVVALREHFRCVPEIIQFSNHLSYNQAILPLREPDSAIVRPAVVAHRVNGLRDKGDTNSIEAEEVASLVVACLQDPAYAKNRFGRPTTFGVISLLGSEQALLIEEHLRLRLPPDVFVKHRLLCGNAAHFQGDERDIIFLSMVDDPPHDGQLTLREAGPKNIFKKRYNVAASRARDQLWVVYSMDPGAHLKSGDLRRRLIEHAIDPQALHRTIEANGAKTDSPFEKLVLKRLVDAGYRVHPQWPVGSRRIDLVVEGKTRRLAVECDGERWHTPEQLNSDLERQAILERLGWTFIRIRGSVFFRDPVTAMVPVFTKLNELEIEPLGPAETAESTRGSTPLVERVRRAAQALRAQWSAERT
jgi:very-short-patch-repair endonuclease